MKYMSECVYLRIIFFVREIMCISCIFHYFKYDIIIKELMLIMLSLRNIVTIKTVM